VQKDDLVRALSVVEPRQVHRIACVLRVQEPDALDDPSPLHVQGRNDASSDHQSSSSRRTAPVYNALPMITPSSPSGSRVASRRPSSACEPPPAAITGMESA